MRYSDLITRRHNAVVNRENKAEQCKHTILSENETVQGNLRLDLMIVKNSKATIIGITILFEKRMEALTEASQHMINKYAALAKTLHSRFNEVKVDAIVLGSLDTWDPENDKLMETLCWRKYLKLFNKLCVSDVIRYTRDIYTEHITGVRQQ
jgi:hypothetical protein